MFTLHEFTDENARAWRMEQLGWNIGHGIR